MSVLSIYCQYDFGETTAAAIRLANFASSCGLEVRWLSSQACRKGVHPRWDYVVRGPYARNTLSWAGRTKIFVWFEEDPTLLDLCFTVTSDAMHIVIADLHRLSPEAVRRLHRFDEVVCPSLASEVVLSKRNDIRQLSRCTWSAGLVCRPVTLPETLSRLLVFVDAATRNRYGGHVLDVIEQVVKNYPSLNLSLLCSGTWRTDYRRRLCRLLKGEPRVVLLPHFTWSDAVCYLHRHDCVWFPQVRNTFGLLPQAAASMGLPIIAWDTSPVSEILDGLFSCGLLPCQKATCLTGGVEAVWDTRLAVKGLSWLLSGGHKHLKCRKPDNVPEWLYQGDEAKFRGFWGSRLGISL